MTMVTETGGPAGPPSELDRLLNGEHADPHRLLGPHGSTILALRPDASAVRLVLHDGRTVDMTRLRPGGLFLADLRDMDGYVIEADFEGGATVRYDDPYRFWPTLGEMDLHLLGEGHHHRLWEVLGARRREHQGVWGTAFAVWAPAARSVRLVGDFNGWDGRVHPMRSLGSSGVWELFVPGVEAGSRYKYEILTADRQLRLKADPMARQAEVPPATDSVVPDPQPYAWSDSKWMETRGALGWLDRPLLIYEMHAGSWRRGPDEEPLSYLDLAAELPRYVRDMGFTHVELMPLAEHPFGGSWGYQVSSYYAPTGRYGSPDGLKALVDALHGADIGVVVDWVPAHFPRDDWALARFDGSAVYEHDDPRRGSHPDWGTLVFNLGRNEVRNFLVANALYWLEEFHVDGLRVDAVASMLYLDYSRREGEWVPNVFGGREDLEAVSFLKEMNEVVHRTHPGVTTIAEESTAWPGVSRPTYVGGLGFGLKWNMGWMHDTLDYFAKEPVHRRYHHDQLTFGLVYAFSENFVLPLSHDEVVHGKGSLLRKMPGDRWQQLANLRALLAWMWAHPGKQLLFMGGELAQEREWSHDTSLDWQALDDAGHRGVQDLVRAINRTYVELPALWKQDFSSEGFRWIDASDVDSNVLSFVRLPGGDPANASAAVVCVANLSPIPRHGYRVGLPLGGEWREAVNTDATQFGGSGVGNGGSVLASDTSWHGLDHSAELNLPPLGVLWLSAPVSEPGR
ncbi:MAG TPA: 1,4-alpha-glucan branching protein GlgB [Acidimicrobiales bacterium]